jgi:magnesium chelatase family protein
VTAARELQARFEQMENIHYNAQMNTNTLENMCLDEVSKQLLKTAMERLNLPLEPMTDFESSPNYCRPGCSS